MADTLGINDCIACRENIPTNLCGFRVTRGGETVLLCLRCDNAVKRAKEHAERESWVPPHLRVIA